MIGGIRRSPDPAEAPADAFPGEAAAVADAPDSLAEIEGWIARLYAGDDRARDALLGCAGERLRRLAQRMLRTYPRVRRWEQTDDVLQSALLRLYRTLRDVPPRGAADFLRLAALNLRRELLDLTKHYSGPRGHGAHHRTADPDAAQGDAGHPPARESADPGRLAAWAEFHEHAGRLPAEEREVFDLIWYQGLSQGEAARLLGVHERTVKRRWQAARLKLYEALHGELPE
jgi:RNA polymerase sigma-70 factor (ECF subfamily)